MAKISDLVGKRFGKLIADEYIGHGKYRCKCDCGNEKIVPTGKLNAGEVKSCGCLKNWNLVGKKFGRLTVVRKLENVKMPGGSVVAKYLCKCECGNVVSVFASALRSGATSSCGCYRKEQFHKAIFNDLTGKRFGRWSVLAVAETNSKKTYWKCKCDCGTVKDVRADQLINGHSVSCGCLRDEAATTHGKSKTRIYRIWIGMRRRCYDSNQFGYQRYGGRGISVCNEWMTDFERFYEWAISNGYDDKKSIDRIDNDGNYEPNNCRWVTMKEQGNNRSSNVFYEYDDEVHTIAEWAEIAKIPYATLKHRIDAGWSIYDAITTPIEQKYSHRKEAI